MKKLVILSGAGMSQESGIRTFRDMDGLWEEYDVTEVATPEAWAKNPMLVMKFYNDRRKQLYEAVPNAGHLGLVDLEKDFEVHISLPKTLTICTKGLEVHRFCICMANSKKHAVRSTNR